MSLLLNASAWTDNPQKKRIPTIKKPLKLPFLEENTEKNMGGIKTEMAETKGGRMNEIEGFPIYGNSVSLMTNAIDAPSSINDHIKIQDMKNDKINQLIDNMTNLKIQNDGDSLYNYTPPNTTEGMENNSEYNDNVNRAVPLFQRNNMNNINNINNNGYGNSPIMNNNNEFIGEGVVNNNNLLKGRGGGGRSNYEFNTPDNLANLVNYSKAYEIPNETRPYYTNKLGISSTSDSFEEKILDKIQYLTHLMEEIQAEKTANITEEFILYTMLGVFVIYVVDAFSKNEKYIR